MDLIKITSAYEFAKHAHDGQFRKVPLNEKYIEHLIRVADKVADYGTVAICSALLHDVVEDTKYTLQDIDYIFGKEISLIVEGLTKDRDKIKTLEKIKVYSQLDSRVALIKLADKIDNLNKPLNEKWAKEQAQLCLGFYIPLGFQYHFDELAKELESLCIRIKGN